MKRLGQYYKETVLSLPEKDRSLIELPVNIGKIHIEKNLFNFRLFAGKCYVECATEEEARYLKVFLDTGLTEVYIPKDVEYLKSILPELEDLKAEHDKIINGYLKSILNRKVKEKIKHEVWMELIQV